MENLGFSFFFLCVSALLFCDQCVTSKINFLKKRTGNVLGILDGVHANLEESNRLQVVLLRVFHAGYLSSLFREQW